MSELTVTNADEVRDINQACINELVTKLQEIKIEHVKVLDSLTDIRHLLESKVEQIETLMCSVQCYSASTHTAINRVTSSIETLNNNLSNGIPRNGSSNNSKSVSLASSVSSSVPNNSNKVTKRMVSINVLFSYVFRLFEGEVVNEAPDLTSIIEKYESNNKINLREVMSIDTLLNEDERNRFNESWNKLKKESDRSPKKKASLVWAIAKNNKDFHRKFEAFKTHYCESSENKA